MATTPPTTGVPTPPPATARRTAAVRPHLEVHGSGEPLLLVHGIGHSARAWDPMLDRLAADFEVLVVDLPGHGGAPELGERPTTVAIAAHLGRLLDELGHRTAHVAGNSLGGLIAMRLAEAGRARSVTAFSPAGMARGWEHLWTRGLLRAFPVLAPQVARVEALSDTAAGRRAAFGIMFGRPAAASPAYVRDMVTGLSDASGFHDTLSAVEEVHHVAPIDVPVTVAWGTRDRLLFPVHGVRWKKAVPDARLVRLPGLGHLPMAEDPAVCANLVRRTARLAAEAGTSGAPVAS